MAPMSLMLMILALTHLSKTEELTPQSSCFHRGCNLALNLSSPCQCAPSCKQVQRPGYGCCDDYLAICEAAPTKNPTTSPSQAPTPIETCRNRCGEASWADSSSKACSCDTECAEFNSCCADYELECIATLTPSPSPTEQPHTTLTPSPSPTESDPIACVDGRFVREDNGTCSCATHCQSCQFNNNNIMMNMCQKCADGYVLDRWLGDCFKRDLCTKVTTDELSQNNVCMGSRASEGSMVCVGRKTTLGDGDVQQSASCDCHPSTCHACELTSDESVHCLQCKDQLYLHNGKCISDIECTVLWDGELRGKGNYNRRCVTCFEKANDCNDCNHAGSMCTNCTNGKYLHDGVCENTCPEGTIPQGLGNDQRKCIK